MTNFYNHFIYKDHFNGFNAYDASRWNLSVEDDIVFRWKFIKKRNEIISVASCGLGSCFLEQTTSFQELQNRITIFKNEALKMNKAARLIQFAFAKKRYAQAHKMNEKAKVFTRPQISSSAFGVPLQFLKSCLSSNEFDVINPKGQIVWQKIKEFRNLLKKEGYYVYLHTHSFPITLHLDLSTYFQSLHHSSTFNDLKPVANRTMFRARGVAAHYKNTESYLNSILGKCINFGLTIDDRHRETIISCDGIIDNNEPYESARHFLNSNKSIVDTASSTGMHHAAFDGGFIKPFIKNSHLRTYAIAQFKAARAQLKELPEYGAIKIIAIRKETIRDCKTNYVWRSHAFGVACHCAHSPNKGRHNEFISTLEKHQNDVYSPCKSGSYASSLPQYRILAENIDRDHSKQIFKLDCLNEKQRNLYTKNFEKLKNTLAVLVKIEKLGLCQDYSSLLDSLRGIEIKNYSSDYHYGVQEVLKNHKKLILKFSDRLHNDLGKSQWDYIYKKIFF